MKLIKLLMSVSVLCGVVILSLSCNANPSSTSTAKTVVSPVQKGTISVSVTGTGNLALAHTEDLAFEMAGTVYEINVSESDAVSGGQVLARLDTTDREKMIAAKEANIVTAQRNLTSKQRNLVQVQMDLQEAEAALYDIQKVQEVQNRLSGAQNDLKIAQALYEQSVKQETSNLNSEYWRDEIGSIKEKIAEIQTELDNVLAGTSTTIDSDVVKALENKRSQIEQVKWNLQDAEQAVKDAETAIVDAQNALAESRTFNPEIKAPFSGFITKVNVDAGKEVQKGTVALQIADPDQFEANIMVTEQDIFSVKLGEEATVSLDALSYTVFPAKVTSIAPIATTSQGVVNYKVTVELTSLIPFNPQSKVSQVSVQPSSSQNITLKDGLSTVVDIVVQEQTDVLMVPTRAITRQGLNSTVQVVTGATTETRTIKIGISDSSNTVVTEGLSEGDQVVYTMGSSGSTSSSSNNQKSGEMMVPGMGGPGMIIKD
jgi:HlyD family secretion protein